MLSQGNVSKWDDEELGEELDVLYQKGQEDGTSLDERRC